MSFFITQSNDFSFEDNDVVVFNHLRILRTVLRLTQVELAHRLGMDRRRYAAVERGEVDLSIKEAQKICVELGIDLSYLFYSDCKMEELMKGTGRLLKEYRESLDLTPALLAKKLGIDSFYVKLWEVGVGFPDPKSLVLLSELHDISVAQLLLIINVL